MMGQQTRSESLFYYFRIEDHIPEGHLLRLVDRDIDFAFVRILWHKSRHLKPAKCEHRSSARKYPAVVVTGQSFTESGANGRMD